MALPIGLLNISITPYLSHILLFGTAPQGIHFMGTLDTRLQYYPKPPTTMSKRSHLDSQHSNLLLPTRWVIWGLYPEGTWWRTLISSHHNICRSTSWQMKDSGSTLSCSPGYNCWSSRTDYILSYWLSVHQGSPTGGSDQGQTDSLVFIVLQN